MTNTVYDAVKAGMDKYPDVKLTTGSPFMWKDTPDGNTGNVAGLTTLWSAGQDTPAAACAIGFAFLGACELKSDKLFAASEQAYNAMHFEGFIPYHNEFDETDEHRQRRVNNDTLYSWSDSRVQDARTRWEREHLAEQEADESLFGDNIPVDRDEYLAALKESKLGGITLNVACE